MESIREQKQQFLRQHILQANYDPNEFMDYCEQEHGGIDIDNWQLRELTEIVYKFIDSKKAPVEDYSEHTRYQNEDIGFGFSQNYSKKQESSPIDPNISNQFNEWGNFIQAEKKEQKYTNSLELNLLDLDFLQSFEGKKQQNKNQQTKTLSVPADVARKLQQGNSNFIVGYNPTYLANTQSAGYDPKKIQKNSKKNQIGEISGNIKPVIASSISPPSVNRNQSPSKEFKEKQNFAITLQTKKVVSKSKLSGKQEVSITGHQIINPNIFVPKYVLYWVTTNPLNIQVKRRFKDFQTLRDLLKKFFPTTQIPHLEKCSRLNETEPAIIQKQILFLQSFINNILMNKELRCKLVEQFLLCPDLDLLKKLFKEYEKLAKPRAIEGLFTTSGSVNLTLKAENLNYLEDQLTIVNYMEDHFTKTKTLYDQLIAGFQESSKKLREIEEMNSSLFSKIKTLNTRYTEPLQCPQLQKALDRIQYLHKQWSQSFKTQAKIIKTQIRHLYRFQSENIKTLQDLLKVESDIRQSYSRRVDKEQANIQQYSSAKLNEFKLNIEVPSKNITVLKHQTAYYSEHCSQESLRYLRELAAKLDSKYKLFCQLQLSIGHDMEGCWREFQSFYR